MSCATRMVLVFAASTLLLRAIVTAPVAMLFVWVVEVNVIIFKEVCCGFGAQLDLAWQKVTIVDIVMLPSVADSVVRVVLHDYISHAWMIILARLVQSPLRLPMLLHLLGHLLISIPTVIISLHSRLVLLIHCLVCLLDERCKFLWIASFRIALAATILPLLSSSHLLLLILKKLIHRLEVLNELLFLAHVSLSLSLALWVRSGLPKHVL